MDDSGPPERESSAAHGAIDDALEAALRAQEPYPVPLGLMSSVLAAVRNEPPHAAVVRPIRAPRLGWAVAAVLLLAVGAYLTFGGTDLLAGMSPFRDDAAGSSLLPFRVGLSGGASGLADLAKVEGAVQTGIDHVMGGVTAVADASEAGIREPLVWIPVAIFSLLAGLAISRVHGGRVAGRAAPLPRFF